MNPLAITLHLFLFAAAAIAADPSFKTPAIEQPPEKPWLRKPPLIEDVADPKTFTPEIWKNLSRIHKGATRHDIDKHLQLYFIGLDDKPPAYIVGSRPSQVLLVTVTFRPAAMDEATFLDPEKRKAWLTRHPAVSPQPTDIATGQAPPFWADFNW